MFYVNVNINRSENSKIHFRERLQYFVAILSICKYTIQNYDKITFVVSLKLETYAL